LNNTPKDRLHEVTYPEKDFLRQGLWKRKATRRGWRSEYMHSLQSSARQPPSSRGPGGGSPFPGGYSNPNHEGLSLKGYSPQ